MAFETHVGSINIPASTGNQAITGVGFQPKAVIFIGSETDSDQSKSEALVALGWATSSSARHSVAIYDFDNNGTSNNGRRCSSTKCILSEAGGSVRYAADFVTMDSDGFTVNWSSVQSGEEVIYMALGGSDLSNAAVLNFTSPTSTGTQATTGVGFQPDAVLLLCGLQQTGELDSKSDSIHFGVGAGTSSTNRATLGATAIDAQATSVAKIKLISTSALSVLNGNSVILEGDLDSLDSDGFTIDWTTVDSSARVVSALCLKGGQYNVGTETQKTSTGTQAKTGVGFQPTGMFVFGGNKATSTSIQADMRISLGAAASTSSRGCHWVGSTDAAGTTVCDSDHDTASVIKHLTEGTPTLNAEADLSSFDSDGFTLNWGTADATAREFAFVAFGSTGGGGGSSIAALSRYYRQLRNS